MTALFRYINGMSMIATVYFTTNWPTISDQIGSPVPANASTMNSTVSIVKDGIELNALRSHR